MPSLSEYYQGLPGEPGESQSFPRFSSSCEKFVLDRCSGSFLHPRNSTLVLGLTRRSSGMSVGWLTTVAVAFKSYIFEGQFRMSASSSLSSVGWSTYTAQFDAII